MKDRLSEIFSKQQELMKRYGMPAGILTDARASTEIKSRYHQEVATAILMEGNELLDWSPWKHWSERSGNKLVDKANLYEDEHLEEIRMEVIDLLHFTVEFAIMLGMDADKFFEQYEKKLAINHERKSTEGY